MLDPSDLAGCDPSILLLVLARKSYQLLYNLVLLDLVKKCSSLWTSLQLALDTLHGASF